MTNRTGRLLVLSSLALGSLYFAAAPIGAAQADDLESLVGEEAQRADERSDEEIWKRALELRDAERLGASGELDRILDARLESPEELTPSGVLLLAAARLQGESPDPTRLSAALRLLIDAGDEAIATNAATLLGNRTFKSLPKGRRNKLVDRLLEAAQDVGRSPAYRLEFAKSAYRIGGGSSRRDANKVLQSFLDSEDAELRALGALAIAEATQREIDGALRRELERLSSVPDERGALAMAFLELEDERAYHERKLQDVRKRYEETEELPPVLKEFITVLNLIEERHLEGGRVDEQDLVEAGVNGMLAWMDPHSSYMPSKIYSKFYQDLDAEYGGIGAYVNDDPDTGLFTIVRPIYSGPAYKAGLATDDKVVRIGAWPTLGQPEEDIIKRLKGKPGTPVELYIWRHGMDPELIDRPTEDMKVVVVRGQIEIPAGTYQMLPGGIGLVELTTFSQKSMEQLQSWIPQMLEDGMRALILDMRRNSGGLLTEAREVADLFLPKGLVVVRTEGRERQPESLRTSESALIPEDMPVVILTSRMTASAAEIVSGALQDHKRATLVGKTTFGKGSVQQLLPILPERQDYWEDSNGNRLWDPGEKILSDWNEDGEVDYAPRVKLTIARYLLPSGRSIHRELDRDGNIVTMGGVKPDHEVDLPLMERWRYEEQRNVRRSEALREYIADQYPENRELFHRLAVNDQRNPEQYPNFDQLVLELDTTLSRDDIRRLVREALRRRVQDDLGREFPWGDYVEDHQVQKAIEIALEELGEEVDDVTDYGLVFDVARRTNESRDIALLQPNSSRNLARARALLEQAREGGAVLDDASLEELLDLIGELDPEEN